jgi:photosystem II stability/assembly factor-like uncharacterized protein
MNGCVVGFSRSEGHSILLRTEDGGQTWQPERKIAGEELQAVYMVDARHGWAVGDRTRKKYPQRMLRLAMNE